MLRLANDAIQEFAHADLNDVREILHAMNFGSLRSWLVDENVRPEHKGFYAMVLGLGCAEQKRMNEQKQITAKKPSGSGDSPATAQAKEPRQIVSEKEQQLNRELLQKLLTAGGTDFRAGYDGIVAGYLLANGDDGITAIAAMLKNPKTPVGDVLHAAKSLRFYHDECPEELREKTSQAVTILLRLAAMCTKCDDRSAARWKNWSVLDEVIKLYDDQQTDIGIQRSVVSYLKVCPLEKAATAPERLRKSDPTGVAKAEAWLKLTQPSK